MENNTNTSEDMNSDISKVKPSLKAALDSGKPSSAFAGPGFPSKMESKNKKNVDNHFEESTKPRSRVVQTHLQHFKADNAEVGSQNKLTEMSSEVRNSESGANQDIDLDGRSESNRRVPMHASKQDTKCGMVSHPVEECKGQTPNSCKEVADGGKDLVFADRNNGVQKKRESSSDENSCFYSKYNKDEPEIKGPITSYSQYQEYVPEYRDKYASYLSLKKILESYSDEFKKPVLESKKAKARGDMDRFNEIWEQIKESYWRCKPRFDRMQKVFFVLHLELLSIKQMIKDFVNERRKRLKAGNLTCGSFSPSADLWKFEKSRNLSPFKFTADTYKDPNIQAWNRADRQGNSDVGFQKGEMVGKLKEGLQDTPSQLVASSKDNNRIDLDKSAGVDRQSISLQRELSDLELRELHESTPDETRVAKQFERKGSFKHTNTYGDINSDITKVKPSLKATLDSGKPSTAFVCPGFPTNLESTSKKNVDNHFEDSTKSCSRVVQTHLQHLKADDAEVGSQNKLTEMSSKFRYSESGANQDIDLDGHSESNRRVPGHASRQDTKRGMGSHPMKESKGQTPNSCEELADGGKESVFEDRDNRDQKKRESSSDENHCSYSKYDKDEPEFKGPITSFSQYEEYVQEFQDKHDCYLSLNKILEEYSDEFTKLSVEYKDAKASGDRDIYAEMREQILESCRRCKPRYLIMQKIFLVLHAELPSIKQRIKDFVAEYNKD